MSYQDHTSPDVYDALGTEGTGIFPILEPLPETESGAKPPKGMAPDRWLMAGGTVVAMIAAYVAFSVGSPPVHAMPSPFGAVPLSTTHAQQPTHTTCIPMQ